jgi:hypothetical protein
MSASHNTANLVKLLKRKREIGCKLRGEKLPQRRRSALRAFLLPINTNFADRMFERAKGDGTFYADQQADRSDVQMNQR